MTTPVLVSLAAGDVDRMLELERSAFDSTMRAESSTVLHRFALGHRAVGAEDHAGRLVGAICFATVKVIDYSALPATFKEYSTQPVGDDADTLCIYSLGVVPEARGWACARRLIGAAFDDARRQGMRQVLADGPLPSLGGNEQVAPRPAVRRMVDRYLETGQFPEQAEFLQDPVLALYNRLTGCGFVKLLPDFLPEDKASEGWRVLLHRDL